MATQNLSSATSIVDYLNTKGQDSSFGARKKLFNDYGFNKMGGEFVGSASQNLNLLKRLQTQDSPAPTANALAATNLPATSAPGAPATPSVVSDAMPKATPPANSFMVNQPVPTQAPAPTANALAGVGVTPPVAPPVTGAASFMTNQPAFAQPATPAPAAAPAANVAPDTSATAPNPAQTTDTSTASATGGISASSIYPGIFGSSNSSAANAGEADVVNTWLNSAEGQAFVNRQDIKELTATAKNQAIKQQLESKYEADKTTLEENLAEHGLAFSGIRSSKVRALATALAASELGADRDLAATLLDSDADLRDAIIKGVADLAKDAADGRKEAIQQLNAIGYAVIGDKLVPTLSAQSAARAEHASEVADRRLQIAEDSAARAEAQFQATYGAGAGQFFNNVQTLIDKAPNATEQDIKLAIRANPDVFGKPTEAQLTDALSLVGMPSSVKDAVAVGTVKSFFSNPIFSRVLPGDQRQEALEAAVKQAQEDLANSGGQIEVESDGKTKTYKLTTSQLSDLIEMVGSVSLDDLDAAK